MTPEKLAKYKNQAESMTLASTGHSVIDWRNTAIVELVAEVERLRADNAALVAAVNAVVNDGRVAEILQRGAPEAFEGLVDALFVD